MLSGACSCSTKKNVREETIFSQNEVYSLQELSTSHVFIKRAIYIACIHYKSYLHCMNSLQEIYKAAYSSYGPIQVH